MKRVVYIFLLLTLCSCNSFSKDEEVQKSVTERSEKALAYCKKHKMNTQFCILIDMKIHPGKNRMFFWSFDEKKVIKSALCCHGSGLGSSTTSPVFSNKNGSNCTSLGKYRIGIRSYSKWGINVHYKLHGLEKTNDNAFKRIVVLHSFTPVPNTEIYPLAPPLGWSLGCPVTGNEMMRFLDSKLNKVDKPVLLWIYN